MKAQKWAQMESLHTSISRWRARGTALFFVGILFGMIPIVEAGGNDDIPELPSLEVKGVWSSLNLTIPMPVKVKAPMLSRGMGGTGIRMVFQIDKNGRVMNIRHNASPFNYCEANLAALMESVLPNWEFTPSFDTDGIPVVVKVALPVKVVSPGNGNADHYAALAIKNPVLLAVLDR